MGQKRLRRVYCPYSKDSTAIVLYYSGVKRGRGQRFSNALLWAWELARAFPSEGQLQRVIERDFMFIETDVYSGASNHSKPLPHKLHLVVDRTVRFASRGKKCKLDGIFFFW